MTTDPKTDLQNPLETPDEATTQDVEQTEGPESEAADWDRTRHARFATSA